MFINNLFTSCHIFSTFFQIYNWKTNDIILNSNFIWCSLKKKCWIIISINLTSNSHKYFFSGQSSLQVWSFWRFWTFSIWWIWWLYSLYDETEHYLIENVDVPNDDKIYLQKRKVIIVQHIISFGCTLAIVFFFMDTTLLFYGQFFMVCFLEYEYVFYYCLFEFKSDI